MEMEEEWRVIEQWAEPKILQLLGIYGRFDCAIVARKEVAPSQEGSALLPSSCGAREGALARVSYSLFGVETPALRSTEGRV